MIIPLGKCVDNHFDQRLARADDYPLGKCVDNHVAQRVAGTKSPLTNFHRDGHFGR